MGMRDLNRYIKAMRTGFYDPFEDIDYEHKNKDNEISVNGNEINKNSEIGEEKIDNQINTKSDENADILKFICISYFICSQVGLLSGFSSNIFIII